MSASFTVDISYLENLEHKIKSPSLIAKIEALPSDPGIIGLVMQAISENFAKEGPGWPSLRAQTIKSSVKGKQQRLVSQMTSKQLLEFELKAREKGSGSAPFRIILQRTGLLKASVTQVGSNHNIVRQEGSTLVWGTDLLYAGIHNNGGVISHPGTNKGFGIPGLKIPPHNIPIPQREFLFLTDAWKIKIGKYVVERIKTFIKEENL